MAQIDLTPDATPRSPVESDARRWFISSGPYLPQQQRTGGSEMIASFHVTGGYTYVDPRGVAVGYKDVLTIIEAAQAQYDNIGLSEDYVKRFIR